MNNMIYCSPAGHPCGNRICEKHLCHSHHGIAVTCTDYADKCENYVPRIIIYADTVEQAIDKIKSETDNGNIPEILSKVEIHGLSITDVLCVYEKYLQKGKEDGIN